MADHERGRAIPYHDKRMYHEDELTPEEIEEDHRAWKEATRRNKIEMYGRRYVELMDPSPPEPGEYQQIPGTAGDISLQAPYWNLTAEQVANLQLHPESETPIEGPPFPIEPPQE